MDLNLIQIEIILIDIFVSFPKEVTFTGLEVTISFPRDTCISLQFVFWSNDLLGL